MAGEDDHYLAWVRTCRCCFCNAAAPSDPHHKTGAGMGTKSHDIFAIPLCRSCHRGFETQPANTAFRWWTKEDKRNWQDAMVRLHRALYAMVRAKGEAVMF